MAIIIKPIVTEKMTQLGEKLNRYGFKVQKNANKIEIKQAVEAMFNVKVTSVNTINVRAKTKRVGRYVGKTARRKKAIVTLAEGNSINLFGEEE